MIVQGDGLQTIADYERAARAALPDATYAYLATGAGEDRTVAANLAAYGRWRLVPRVLVDVSDLSPAATILGRSMSMPVLIAPTAAHRLFDVDGELATTRAAARAGVTVCVSSTARATISEIRAAAPDGPLWLQIQPYRDAGLCRALVDQAAASGFESVVMMVGSAARPRRLRAERAGDVSAELTLLRDVLGPRGKMASRSELTEVDASMTWPRLARFIEDCRLPVLTKGIMTASDAIQACEAGSAGVIVSNHGGRQLDDVQAGLDALSAAATAVAGRVPVLVDGGIRRGSDVIKALALGANAVLIGRPILYALAVGGEAAVDALLALVHDEIVNAMALLGCPTLSDISPHQIAASG